MASITQGAVLNLGQEDILKIIQKAQKVLDKELNTPNFEPVGASRDKLKDLSTLCDVLGTIDLTAYLTPIEIALFNEYHLEFQHIKQATRSRQSKAKHTSKIDLGNVQLTASVVKKLVNAFKANLRLSLYSGYPKGVASTEQLFDSTKPRAILNTKGAILTHITDRHLPEYQGTLNAYNFVGIACWIPKRLVGTRQQLIDYFLKVLEVTHAHLPKGWVIDELDSLLYEIQNPNKELWFTYENHYTFLFTIQSVNFDSLYLLNQNFFDPIVACQQGLISESERDQCLSTPSLMALYESKMKDVEYYVGNDQ